MKLKDIEKYKIEDKKKILEAQKEIAESFKQYFGDYEIVASSVEQLEKKLNNFFEWRNNKWIVPGKNKTPEQLWLEADNPKTKMKKISLRNRFDDEMSKFALMAHPIFGIVIVPFYDILKTLFEGDYNSIPDYLGFLCDIVVETKSFIPPFVIKDLIIKNKERTLELFKKAYTNVKTIDDVYNILEKYRKDWCEEPNEWITVINKEKKDESSIKEGLLAESNKSMKEFDMAWEEFFENKPQPKNDEEDRKQQEEFHYWYNNVRKQSDTGKTPMEMGERIMDFEWDENYDEDYEESEEELENVPWEVKLIGKVSFHTSLGFENEEEKAVEKFAEENKNKLKLIKSEKDFNRGFQAWFNLEYRLPNGLTPMEWAFSNDKMFEKKELEMIKNFLDHKNSLFEVIKISDNKKDYTLKNIMDSKEYYVETIDFPAVLKIGDFLNAVLVEKLGGNYFFYGNVMSYSKKEGEKMKRIFLEEIKKNKIG